MVKELEAFYLWHMKIVKAQSFQPWERTPKRMEREPTVLGKLPSSSVRSDPLETAGKVVPLFSDFLDKCFQPPSLWTVCVWCGGAAVYVCVGQCGWRKTSVYIFVLLNFHFIRVYWIVKNSYFFKAKEFPWFIICWELTAVLLWSNEKGE